MEERGVVFRVEGWGVVGGERGDGAVEGEDAAGTASARRWERVKKVNLCLRKLQ
jgi:hypothetical protein